MQAIRTRYRGPTNYKGSKIAATCDAGSLSVPYDHALDSEGNHIAARNALLVKLGWLPEHGYKGTWAHGQFADGAYYHVCTWGN